MFKKPLWQTVWTQIRLLPIGAVCSGSTLFASIFNLSVHVMDATLGTSITTSNVRQLFAADDFSRRHFQKHFFFLGALRVNTGCLKCLFHSMPIVKKCVSMTRNCHNQRSHTNPWHREEDTREHIQRHTHKKEYTLK